MAKLARLMSSDLPLSIEPEQIASSGKELTGEIPLVQLAGVAELARVENETARYRLSFYRNDKGLITINGEIATRLLMPCQRCLEDMQLSIQTSVAVGIVSHQDEVELLENDLEPFLAEDGKISLARLIEEEILLCLPISVLHGEENCPATATLQEYHARPESPFAALKNLKKETKT